MKISIIVSVIILAVATTFGVHDRQRLADIRASHEKLVAEAAQLGLPLDPADGTAAGRFNRGDRADRGSEAKKIAADFIAFAKEIEAIKAKGDQPDAAFQKRVLALMDRLMSLDAAGFKTLLTEINASKEISDDTRDEVVGFTLMMMADKHPQTTLNLFIQSPEIFRGVKGGAATDLTASALGKWAKEDPTGAMAWALKNGAQFPELLSDKAKRELIAGAATKNPALAFQMLSELKITDRDNSIKAIIDSATTPADRDSALAALRNYLKTIPDEKDRSTAADHAAIDFASKAIKEGFEVGSKWIDAANFSPSELQAIVGKSLRNADSSAETGKWLTWMGDKVPIEKSHDSIRNMVSDWTNRDYRAAGKWLTDAPEGPAKNASIEGFVRAVSKYNPEAAVDWALTLPAGQEREQSMKEIHGNWPKSDPASAAAAEAFAKKHGIK